MKDLIISGPSIYTEEGMIHSGQIVIENGLIQAISKEKNHSPTHLHFPANYHLIPGLIDLHVHGANHYDVMDATPAALQMISQTLAAEGTTAFLATTMTQSAEQIEKALLNVSHFIQSPVLGAQILGVHLEGPFISAKKVGAQNSAHLLMPSIEQFAHWQKISGHNIKLVTLAPELPHSDEFIRYLKHHHIIAAIGHSDASYAETMAAITAGCNYATHLFNAMRGIHQREPGAVTAALLSPEMMTELIVDGVHLHPAIVQLILQLKGKEKMVLVTDAMRAKCLRDGTYDLGGQDVLVNHGVATLADGTLAGSVLSLPAAIQNMLRFTSCELQDVVKMASENPAKALGIFDKRGSIALQKEADLVVLDEKLQVVLTVCQGKVVYQNNATSY